MSRSRPPKCSVGRGCPVCGDAGEVRRLRERDALAVDDLQVEPRLGDLYYDPYDPHGCDGDCTLCDPAFYEREAIRRRMIVESPRFTMAERVLTRAGIRLAIAR